MIFNEPLWKASQVAILALERAAEKVSRLRNDLASGALCLDAVLVFTERKSKDEKPAKDHYPMVTCCGHCLYTCCHGLYSCFCTCTHGFFASLCSFCVITSKDKSKRSTGAGEVADSSQGV